jgi:hypothetical protein
MLSIYDTQTVSEFLEEHIPSEEARDVADNFLEHTESLSCE